MYGDTTVIRKLARSMRERAGALVALADDLAGRADAVDWTGLAGDAMRRASGDHAKALRACAAAHDEAADALDRHARAVDHVKELIGEVEHRFLGVLASAGDHLAGWARHVDPPPPGSLAWLDVQVPR
jgi:uncharacterized protein YukE